MIRVFSNGDKEVKKVTEVSALDELDLKNVIWVDLQNVSPEDTTTIERKFGIVFQTAQQTEEIESSSRFFENDNSIITNSNFLVLDNGQYSNKPVSFILKNEVLFTTRNYDLKSFAETVKKIRGNPRIYSNGGHIMLTIFEIRIDLDADLLETIAHLTTDVSVKMRLDKDLSEDILFKITQYQETTILIRENIVDRQRTISALLRSDIFPRENYEKLRVLIKDIHSLLSHTTFSFERLEYLQNTFLGLVNIQQNKIIKIFTVASVVFMPPTLIASIYGMNFRVMPELSWSSGYPFAIFLMLASSFITLFLFRKKKWL
jgi:magnesium transporter